MSQKQLLEILADFLTNQQIEFIKLEKLSEAEALKKRRRRRIEVQEGDNQGVKITRNAPNN